MKSTTLAVALVLLYVLIILSDADGTHGPSGRPRSIMRPQPPVGLHHAPIMRPQRAVPHGQFRRSGRPQEPGRMTASLPRYARGTGEIFDGTRATFGDVASGGSDAADSTKNIGKITFQTVRSDGNNAVDLAEGIFNTAQVIAGRFNGDSAKKK